MHTTDESIEDTKDYITPFIQQPDKTPSLFAGELVANTLPCGNDYKEQYLKEIFIKGIERPIRQSMSE